MFVTRNTHSFIDTYIIYKQYYQRLWGMWKMPWVVPTADVRRYGSSVTQRECGLITIGFV